MAAGTSPQPERFDVVVIGTGVAGATIASTCRAAGRRVAIVDSRPFGGTCALRGCDPKKVLVTASETIDRVRRAAGIRNEAEVAIDWPALVEFERSFTENVPNAREKAFAEEGIEALHGRAHFRRDGALEVDGRLLEAQQVAVAAGSRPRSLGIPGEDLLATSDDFLALRALPARIVFVGGGYVAFELAHVARRAGAEVTLLVRGDRPLRGFDPELVRRLVDKSERLGIEVRTGREVTAVARADTALEVVASGPGGEERTEADLAVHAAGRVPDIDDLGLDRVGVDHDVGGIHVDAQLRSVSNPAIYAAGDAAAAGPPLTPKAIHDAQVAATNLLGQGPARHDYRGIPTVLFTMPRMASVGWHEEAARREGLPLRVHEANTTSWFSARQSREDTAGHRILVEEDTERILGAHLIGPDADELINLFALAIQADLRAPDLKSALFGYPTAASDIASML